jgi:hypothetical protein
MRDERPDVRDLERRRLRALVDVDLETAAALHADDYELVSPSGDRWSKAGYLGAIASGALQYDVFEPESDVDVLDLTDAAAVRYVARIDIHSTDGWRDTGRFLHTDLWRRRAGRWQAVWSQATRMSDG